MEQYKWNYILDNNADEDHKDEDDGENDEDESDVDNEPCRLLSTGASPPVCLLFVGWLPHRLVPPPRITFHHLAAACIHPRPLLFVLASWLSRCISSHRICLSMRRRLTTGCVLAVADARA